MYFFVKRAFDFVVSLAASLVLLPVFILLAAAIKLDSPGPVFFTQKRVGRRKSLFTLYKFRTMYTSAPGETPTHELTQPEKWITPLGRFLRESSLDELPQLWNILFGNMSLVGPRPALWNQFDLIEARDRYIGRGGLSANDVRPGLTGWAQINGRDTLDSEQKAYLDGEYVQRMCVRFDLVCIFRTARSVGRREGVLEGGGSSGGARGLNITILSAYYAPEITPITHLMQNIADDLASHGHSVRVVCNIPTRGLSEEAYRKGRKRVYEVTENGVCIRRVGARTRERSGLAARALRFAGNTWALYREARRLDTDVYLITHIPPFLGVVGKWLNRRARTVYILQDIFPDSIFAMGKLSAYSPVGWAFRKIESESYTGNAHLVTVSPDMWDTLLQKGVPDWKLDVVENWADTAAIRPVPRAENPLFDELGLDRAGFYVVFAGTLGILQDPDVILDAAKRLLAERAPLQFVLFGGGTLLSHVEARIRTESLDNVRLFPLQPVERVSEVYSLGDIALVTLKEGVTKIAMPSKTWSAMAAARPLVCTVDAGSHWEKTIVGAGAGLCVRPGHDVALAATLKSLYGRRDILAQMGERGRQYVDSRWTREKATAEYERILVKVYGKEKKHV